MARILDETFRSEGYNEIWTETINAGCSINENFLTTNFTAGTTPSVNWGKYCMRIETDGNATNAAKITARFSAEFPITYTRVEFMVISAALINSAWWCLMQLTSSASEDISIHLAYTSQLDIMLTIKESNATSDYFLSNITTNTTYSLEVKWDITNERSEIRLGSTSLMTINITAVGGVERNIRGITVGNRAAASITAKVTCYFDNITINTDTWPNSVGSGYDDPLRTCEYLSTQKSISMEL